MEELLLDDVDLVRLLALAVACQKEASRGVSTGTAGPDAGCFVPALLFLTVVEHLPLRLPVVNSENLIRKDRTPYSSINADRVCAPFLFSHYAAGKLLELGWLFPAGACAWNLL